MQDERRVLVLMKQNLTSMVPDHNCASIDGNVLVETKEQQLSSYKLGE
jgi:hypothetical protein